jgi:hypothetical protein
MKAWLWIYLPIALPSRDANASECNEPWPQAKVLVGNDSEVNPSSTEVRRTEHMYPFSPILPHNVKRKMCACSLKQFAYSEDKKLEKRNLEGNQVSSTLQSNPGDEW